MKNKIEEKMNKFINETSPVSTTGVFNTVNAEAVVLKLKNGIKAPVVNVYASRLGGNKNVAILISLSLDPKNKWPNGIYQNSRYMQFYLYNNGDIEQFSFGHAIKMKFRKTRVISADDAIAKINKYIVSVSNLKEVEVSNVVAPELNVDRDRATWLKKQGYKDVEGLSDGREMQTSGVFEDTIEPKKPLQNLGWANGWGDKRPSIVDKCYKLGHHPTWREESSSVSTVTCPKCGYTYKSDSSD